MWLVNVFLLQIIRAKKAAEARHRYLDSNRKKFKEDLESRERALQEEKDKQQYAPNLTQQQKLQVCTSIR